MKKLIVLTLALLLALSLVACGGGNAPSGSTSTPGGNNSAQNGNNNNTPDVDMGSIIGGTGKPSDYNAATRQAMIDAARADGGNLEFKADGSMVYTDPDGSVTIQNADGTWTYQGEDGSQAQLGGDWPDNALTKLVPNPGFKLTASSGDETDMDLVFSDVTLEQIRAYVEKVKAAGFTVDAQLEDETTMGIEVYSYDAKNAAGYRVYIAKASNMMSLNISAPR